MIHHGDSLEILKGMEANSVDSVVTDPPAGISFMGKEWDHNKGGRDAWIIWMSSVMRECLRVMKPGAHGLIWAIPRTSHWTATALEDAGFEVRDVITHLFGSGFPKSLDISKAIDKAAGAEREVVGLKTFADGQTYNGGEKSGRAGMMSEGKLRGPALETSPSTLEAKLWQGFGTALKPAAEMWILIRKPLSEKTVAANVLKHGTGGLNIDGCRVGTHSYTPDEWAQKGLARTTGNSYGEHKGSATQLPQGRFPANLLFSHNGDCVEVGEYQFGKPLVFDRMRCSPGCAVAGLDEQSGALSPGHTPKVGSSSSALFKRNPKGEIEKKWDSGGASRFFYVAKASKSERNAGLDTPSSHPTVKPLKLMRYLIRLVTPPNGVVLDPFCGSGSTGVAATQEGFHFIGIEKEKEYVEIAEKRMEHVHA